MRKNDILMPSGPESQDLEGYTQMFCLIVTPKQCWSCRTLGILVTKSYLEVTVSVITCEILALLPLL